MKPNSDRCRAHQQGSRLLAEPASGRPGQQGFSLIETLVALLLFSLSFSALMQYQLVLADGFQRQWQQRSAWRNAHQLLLGQPLPNGWQGQRLQQPGPGGCQLLTARVVSPAGRRAELTQLRCSESPGGALPSDR